MNPTFSESTKSVIDAAKLVFAGNWPHELNEGKAAADAEAIAKIWQERVVSYAPDRFKTNVPIAGKLKDTIELVDFQCKVAYELKVSGRNPAHAFYKDVFKVLVYNQHHNVTKLERLVFITQSVGVDEIENGFGKIAADYVSQFNLKVDWARLD